MVATTHGWKVQAMDMAVWGVQHGLMPSFLASITNLPKSMLVALWNEYNEKSAKGQIPHQAATGIKTVPTSLEAATWTNIYCQMMRDNEHDPEQQMESLIVRRSYETFLAMKPNASLSATLAFIIARDLQIKALSLPWCPSCRTHYLKSNDPHHSLLRECQYCRIGERLLKAG